MQKKDGSVTKNPITGRAFKPSQFRSMGKRGQGNFSALVCASTAVGAAESSFRIRSISFRLYRKNFSDWSKAAGRNHSIKPSYPLCSLRSRVQSPKKRVKKNNAKSCNYSVATGL
jgi:hypothetical protein